MDRYDVYGNLVIEGLSCGLAVAGVAVEASAAAALPPAGFIAAAAITSSALGASANCAVFVAHAVAIGTGSLSGPGATKQFEIASQVASSISSPSSALNTLGYLTGDTRFNDAAAIAIAAKILASPGKTQLEQVTRGVENVRSLIDIGSRLQERDEESATAKSAAQSPASQTRNPDSGPSSSNKDSKGDAPTVSAPVATETKEVPKEEKTPEVEGKPESPPVQAPAGKEDEQQSQIQIHMS